MTKVKLDFEAGDGAANNCADDNSCVVEVTVKDPLGNRVDNPALDTITVTITVNNLNEAPTVSGPVLLIRHAEGSDLILDSDPTTDAVENTTFTADDPDDPSGATTATDATRWELSGPDASKFSLGTTTPVPAGATSPALQFKAAPAPAPNFEKPGDANGDNVYQVTVVARDTQLVTGSRDVTIRVTNVDEDGSVSLSHVQPEVATSLTATLTDVDGGITGLKWQWYRGDFATDPTTTLPTTDCAGNADSCRISGATSRTYTPKPGDADPTGRTLTVTATYDDTIRNDQSEPTVLRTASNNAVRAAVSPNPQPKFYKDGVDATVADNRITSNETRSYTRYITENLAADTNVQVYDTGGALTDTGADVTATDDDNEDTTDTNNDQGALQYELGGASKDYFKIDQTTARATAVTIQTAKMLDREEKGRHTVTVKATDPSGGTATATVTIIVVDVDEVPKIDNAGPMYIPDYMENGTAAVANYMAADPEGKAITWIVLGNDAGATTFDAEDLKPAQKSGPRTMLAFNKSPNYESPTGGTAGDSNIYSVQLQAKVVDFTGDCTAGATEVGCVNRAVMVGVTDVEEAPAFSDASKTLTVKEHTKADDNIDDDDYIHRNVGVPVTAKDSDGDDLTYSLGGNYPGTFTIVPATGQIKTMKKLDYEMKDSYSVVVTATDPTGLKDTINITIEVEDVAEAPDIVPDGVEIVGGADVDFPENSADAVGTYTAEGPQAASATWMLEGTDAAAFMVEGSGASVMLKFVSSPDYENEADADTDNIYMVTLKAMVPSADGSTTDYDTHEVMVTVSNVDEDGTVTLSPSSPAVGSMVTAELSDPDGGVTGTTWQWASASAMAGPFTDIAGATSASYTPGEGDAGMYLMATATYDDVHDTDQTASSGAAMVGSADPVSRYDGDNDGEISISELFNAIDDYFADAISIGELFDVMDAYFG